MKVQGNDSIKNATSILDYVFRELAVSYLGRTGLAHVEPSEMGFDALGKGEGRARRRACRRPACSPPGFVRKPNLATSNVVVMSSTQATPAPVQALAIRAEAQGALALADAPVQTTQVRQEMAVAVEASAVITANDRRMEAAHKAMKARAAPSAAPPWCATAPASSATSAARRAAARDLIVSPLMTKRGRTRSGLSAIAGRLPALARGDALQRRSQGPGEAMTAGSEWFLIHNFFPGAASRP